jgi:hypothetical protein
MRVVDIGARFEQAAHLIVAADMRHVEHAVGLQCEHILQAVRGFDANGANACELSGVTAHLGGAMHIHADHLEIGVLDGPAQCPGTDIAGGPLHDAIKLPGLVHRILPRMRRRDF